MSDPERQTGAEQEGESSTNYADMLREAKQEQEGEPQSAEKLEQQAAGQLLAPIEAGVARLTARQAEINEQNKQATEDASRYRQAGGANRGVAFSDPNLVYDPVAERLPDMQMLQAELATLARGEKPADPDSDYAQIASRLVNAMNTAGTTITIAEGTQSGYGSFRPTSEGGGGEGLDGRLLGAGGYGDRLGEALVKVLGNGQEAHNASGDVNNRDRVEQTTTILSNGKQLEYTHAQGEHGNKYSLRVISQEGLQQAA